MVPRMIPERRQLDAGMMGTVTPTCRIQLVLVKILTLTRWIQRVKVKVLTSARRIQQVSVNDQPVPAGHGRGPKTRWRDVA